MPKTSNPSGYTPIEQRMINLLSDGIRHSYEEMFQCLDDELAGNTAVLFHITNLKNKLAKKGFGITSQRENKVTYYRMVRFIGKSSEE